MGNRGRSDSDAPPTTVADTPSAKRNAPATAQQVEELSRLLTESIRSASALESLIRRPLEAQDKRIALLESRADATTVRFQEHNQRINTLGDAVDEHAVQIEQLKAAKGAA